MTKEPSFRATAKRAVQEGREPIYLDGERQPRAHFVDEVDGGVGVADGGDENDDGDDNMDDDFEPVVAEARATDSLFDAERFDTLEESLAYMQKNFDFYLPEPAYLADATGCVKYLCEKVKVHRVCLFCERVFKSFHACQQHMMDKAHAKIPYDTDEQVDELAEFYDFSSADRPFDDGDAATTTMALVAMDDDDGWETASEGSDDDGGGEVGQKTAGRRSVARITVLPSGELLVRRGTRQKVIGARWLQRYYKQNFRLDDDREAVLAIRDEHNRRLLAVYEKAGVDTNSIGFFARGLANQFNRRAVNKTIRRDQRMETRAQQARFGQKNGGNAKDWTWNTRIKNKVAGKNVGEGLGVHG